MKKIAAAEFKAKCLKLMENVSSTREPLIVTKRGKPLVRLVPADDDKDDFIGRLEGVTIRPITPEIAALAAQFPEDYPKDPADRLIGATARVEGMTLVTRDERIRRSPLLKTVW